ncbi:unnamed protein product, partial [Effrenium voratum]
GHLALRAAAELAAPGGRLPRGRSQAAGGHGPGLRRCQAFAGWDGPMGGTEL